LGRRTNEKENAMSTEGCASALARQWRAAVWFLGAVAAAAGAAAPPAGLEAVTCAPPNRFFAPRRSDVRVDADLAEWSWDQTAIVVNTETGRLQPPPVRSAADASAIVQFAWDEEFLYLASVIRDQSLVPLGKADAMPWTCDSLMLSMTTFGATLASPRYRQTRTAKTAKELFFGYSWYGEKTGPRKWTENSRYAVARTPDGYVVEAAVSLADVGYDPRAGDRVKVAFILVDHDADGKFAQILLGHEPGGTPAHWLDLRFRDAAPYAGEIVPVQVKFAAGAPLIFSGQVDALAPGVRITGLRVKDGAGKRVATLAGDVPLEAGKRTLFTGTLADLALAPGKYSAALVTEHEGTEANGAVRADFRIIASEEAAMGVAGRLPDRYIVPDPTRFAFPSDRRKYKPRAITKEDYIALCQRVCDAEPFVYAKGREAKAGIHGPYYALPAYAVYKHTGNRDYLDVGLGLMQHAHETHAKHEPTPHWDTMHKIASLFLDDPDVPENDKKWLREFTPRVVARVWPKSKPQEWGAFNRPLIWGHFLDLCAQLMPQAPDVAAWRAYVELEWQSWRPYCDHDENSSDYNAASMMGYLDWAAFREPESLRRTEFAVWIERYMHQVTPAGGFPGYGDASPWNASCYAWMPVFERMASITGDGRFKWVARRLFDYADRQIDDLLSYHMVCDGASRGCAWAYLYADDDIPEVLPEMKSRITTRKRVLKVDEAFKKEMFDKHNITGLFYRLAQDEQPDKLILRAGGDPFAPCGMIELCSDAGHHMSTVPNFNCFMHQRAVLLTDLGYYEKGPEYHNVVFIEDLTGIAPETDEEKVSVPVFEVPSRATYASVVVDNYKGWPATNDRRILFTHEGPVVVKDLLMFREPFVARVRQQWQTRNISPKAGPNWVNVNIPFVLRTGLGQGRGVSRWLNPNWDLLIYFAPQPGRDYEVHDRALENIWQAVPLRVSQRWRGLPGKDSPVHFTTLLWPHKPVLEVEDYVKRIRVLADTPQTTAFDVQLTDARRMILGINDSGQTREFGPVRTDAAAFVLQLDGADPAAKPGWLFAHSATEFTLDARELHRSAQSTTVDKTF